MKEFNLITCLRNRRYLSCTIRNGWKEERNEKRSMTMTRKRTAKWQETVVDLELKKLKLTLYTLNNRSCVHTATESLNAVNCEMRYFAFWNNVQQQSNPRNVKDNLRQFFVVFSLQSCCNQWHYEKSADSFDAMLWTSPFCLLQARSHTTAISNLDGH